MNNVTILMLIMLCYGIILIVVIEQGFNKLLNHENKLSRYIRNMEEVSNLIDDLDTNEPKEIINYRINRLKQFIKRFRHG